MLTSLYSTIPALARQLPLHVCAAGRFNNLVESLAINTGQAYQNAGWTANNRAHYTPIHMPAPFTIARFMIASGNTTGNADVGLYNSAGTRLLSTGTVAKSTAAVMYFDVTNTRFPAGHYYLALVVSTTSGTVFRANLPDEYNARMCGMLQEALGSTVLPATMTPVVFTSNSIHLYGFSQSDTL